MSTCGLCGLSSVHELAVGPTLLPHLPVAPSSADSILTSAGKCVAAAPDCSEVCPADSCESHKACHLHSPIGSYMRSVRASPFQLHVATAPSACYFSVKTGRQTCETSKHSSCCLTASLQSQLQVYMWFMRPPFWTSFYPNNLNTDHSSARAYCTQIWHVQPQSLQLWLC